MLKIMKNDVLRPPKIHKKTSSEKRREMSPLGNHFCLNFNSFFEPKRCQFKALSEKRTENRATRKRREPTSKKHEIPDPEIWGRR